jgi:hypothetical protein
MFPEGLSIENGEFRTATISPILSLIKEQKEAILIGQATLAGVRGFEPLLYGPEPHVLPLDDTPIESNAEFYHKNKKKCL